MTILFLLNIFYKSGERLVNLIKDNDMYWFMLSDRIFIIKYIENVWVCQQHGEESATGILPVNNKYRPVCVYAMANKQLGIQFDLVEGG